jgi:uncharacterized protein (TIGR02147 family)
MQVYDFTDYRLYLKQAYSGSGRGRGKRGLLANYLNCQPSFLTQVFMERAHLSLEHALSTCDYLRFDESESQYFMLLVQKAKAGTKKLEDFFEKELKKIREKRDSIDARIRIQTHLSAEEQMTYYSVWYYSAIHILCSLPNIKTSEDISEYLGLDLLTVKEAMHFLKDKGFVTQSDGDVGIGSRRIHLKKGNSMLPRHHANWRMKAITALDHEKKDELHYTAVLGISKKDYSLFRERMMSLLGELEPVITKSPEEIQVVMLLDLFQT